MEHILEINSIKKSFDSTVAVDGIDLAIPKGTIFGLLGPNGAGKTTLIRIITHIFYPDEGQITFLGEPLTEKHQEKIGYMPEERGLYRKMKVGEQLMYLTQLKGLPAKTARERIKFWMQRFDIESWWSRKVEELSKGMQQKIQFITTVVHNPPLLILDEPFSGLDPINTELIKEEIHQLKNEGKTIIFSTHRMEQVEEICEEIALINKGKIILKGKVADIKNQFKENKFCVRYTGDVVPQLHNGYEVVSLDDHQMVVKLNQNQSPNDLLINLINQNVEIHEFEEILPSLNEVFIKTVKQTESVHA